MQRNHYNTNFYKETFPVVLICDNIINAPNIGSLFRTADAFGVEKLIFCGESIEFSRKVTKTSRATEKAVNFLLNQDIYQVVDNYKNKGYQILAIEITTNSKPIHHFKFPNNKPLAVIVGSENFGISEDVLSLCDDSLHIEMYGQNSSMNVVQATSIALYEITKQIKGQ